jgi:methylenetetrahydrofolate dehydrogenase (NADP+) / methenyltetrahydrofolate cyclohydrolase
VADALLAQARAAVGAGVARGWRVPRLASVHRDAATPFSAYLRQQAKIAAAAGLEFRAHPLTSPADQPALEATLAALDGDRAVHGVLVEHPLPPPFDFHRALRRLRPEKDVDGVGWQNLGRLLAGHPLQVPAVARAAVALLRAHGFALAGRRIGVVGRSPTVGLPLALLLLLRGESGDATVTVAHSRTPDLAGALAGCDAVISCAGRPGLLRRSVVPRGAVVIDVGLSSVADPERPGASRMVGDADAEDLEGWAAAITPVPGGVGPVTVAMLMANAVLGWEALEGAGGT